MDGWRERERERERERGKRNITSSCPTFCVTQKLR